MTTDSLSSDSCSDLECLRVLWLISSSPWAAFLLRSVDRDIPTVILQLFRSILCPQAPTRILYALFNHLSQIFFFILTIKDEFYTLYYITQLVFTIWCSIYIYIYTYIHIYIYIYLRVMLILLNIVCYKVNILPKISKTLLYHFD